MKKSFAIFSFIFCILLTQIGAFASDTPIGDKNSTEISVSFKAGSGTYLVNDKNVKAEPSVQTGGKTFVPVKVISDALGAALTVDIKAKTAVITYNNVDIKLTEKKKEAVISGKKVTIDAAPYIKNNSFMASVSSLADILGADVKSSDGKITFLKEIANPNSIKDFSALIKDTSKAKIGDSYYKWSMQLPEDLNLEYRNFNGSENIFASQDETYFVSVYLYNADKDSNLDNVVNYMNEKIKNFTLVDYSKDRNNGKDYVEFVYMDDEYTIRDRTFLTDSTEYDIAIFTKNEGSYDDEKYQKLMNSFDFKFDRISTEDLSDVTTEGYRTYQDTRLKWSINMIPYWEEHKDDKIQNKIAFSGKEFEYMSVSVYSLDKGETLDSVTQDMLGLDAATYSPEFYKVINQEKVKVGESEGNKVYYTLKYPKKMVYGYELIFTDKNYKYIIEAQMPEEIYNSTKDKNKFLGMLDSFTFKQLDPKSTGKLLDPKKIILADRTRKVEEPAYTLEVPFNWVEDEKNDGITNNYYLDNLNVNIEIIDDVPSFSEYLNFINSTFNKDNFSITENKTAISDKGYTGYKYVITYTDKDGYKYRIEKYFIHKDNKVYAVTFFIDNLHYGTNNIKLIDQIWKSFKLK